MRLTTALVLALGATACASPGAPPGGPVDHSPPAITKVSPDSGATNVKAKGIVVQFDEVIGEKPRTGLDLSAAVVLSPSDGAARVSWERDAMTIRPRKGFRPNTAYALTLLPGIVDLRGNAITKPRTFVFSTGASVPRGVVRGAVFDWVTLRPAANADIQAIVGKDTTFRWIARTDSSGRYTLPLLPAGSYVVRSLIDGNNNGRVDPRELWDSVTVTVSDSVRTDLYAFAHDTIGARVVGVDVKDSVTVRLTFDRPLALLPALRLDQIELRRADSSRIALRTLVRAADYDSLSRVRTAATRDSIMRADTSKAGRLALARADSAKVLATRDSIERARVAARRAARDTVQRVPPPVPARAAISAEYVVELDTPLVPGTYRVVARDVVSVSRVARTSERTFTRAKPTEKKEPAKPPTGAALRGDSTAKAPQTPAASTKPPIAKP